MEEQGIENEKYLEKRNWYNLEKASDNIFWETSWVMSEGTIRERPMECIKERLGKYFWEYFGDFFRETLYLITSLSSCFGYAAVTDLHSFEKKLVKYFFMSPRQSLLWIKFYSHLLKNLQVSALLYIRLPQKASS